MSEYDPWYHGPGTATATPPAQPPVDPAPNVQVAPGYTPNYGDIINRDPGYMTALNAAQRGEATSAAQRRQALRDALIRYGGIGSFKDTYGDIDQATLDLASKNSNSTLAQLAMNKGLSEQAFRKQLAARGALQSGDLNFGQDQLDNAYSQQRYDAANAFGNFATDQMNQYTGVLNTNAQNLAAAIAAAQGNAQSNPNYQPKAAQYADYDSGASASYGRALYKMGDQLYGADGQVFNPGYTDWFK